VTHETLILHADDDPLVPLANARTIARRMPNARLHVLEDAGHLFLLDDPDVGLGIIEAFLADAGVEERRAAAVGESAGPGTRDARAQSPPDAPSPHSRP
jgi:pimeloyl-ACP methyl ester carboxylesterase